MDSDTIVSDSVEGNEIPQSNSSVPDVEVLSTEAMVDELTISLCNTKTSFCLINKSDVNVGTLKRSIYEAQAKYKMYRIPIFRPPPAFAIQLKHLEYHLKKELTSLDKETLDNVMKEAVGRICERVDKRYFLLSVKPLLRWRLER
jgi:hypothetical protein